MKSAIRRCATGLGAVVAAVAIAAMSSPATALTAPVTTGSPAVATAGGAAQTSDTAEADEAAETAEAAEKRAADPNWGDWPSAEWKYTIDASCQGYENQIRQAANWWGYAVETDGEGTFVECVGQPFDDAECGGDAGLEIIGCNWGGTRIKVATSAKPFTNIVGHEFGHNWNDHSDKRCGMTFDSAWDIMPPITFFVAPQWGSRPLELA